MFIVIEGMDGSGKTSLACWLVEWLHSRGVAAVQTMEPTRKPIGEFIRDRLRTGEAFSPAIWAVLFHADRLHHAEELRSWLRAGKTVVCDRYADSTWVYQQHRYVVPADLIPDITFVLDLPVRVAVERLRRRGEGMHAFEHPAKLEGVRQRYLDQVEYATRFEGRRMCLIDADAAPELVQQAVLSGLADVGIGSGDEDDRIEQILVETE